MTSFNKNLRILQLTTNFKQGGIQRHILDLTAFLRKKGHHVTLAGAANVWGNRDVDPDFEEIRLDLVSAINPGRLSRLKAIYDCSRKLKLLLKDREIDLIHCHETAPAIVARIALGTSRVPTAITYHGSAPSRTKQFATVSRYCADRVISPSQTTLNELIEFGVASERTKVLGLGIAEKPKPDEEATRKMREELGAAPDDVICFSLSRLDFQKGIDIMIDVAKEVLDKNPNTLFLVGGTGPMADEVQSWPQDAGIASRFKFLGSVSNVENYLAAADIFLLTSRWEALPISIVEAFRAGLPVIATDCGGVKELVNDKVGRLRAVGDVAGLSSAICELATSKELRLKLSRNALELSQSDRFDPDSVHQAFEDFYLDMVQAK